MIRNRKRLKKGPRRPRRETKTEKWRRLARVRLELVLSAAQEMGGLRRIGPRAAEWSVGIQILGRAAMTRLNHAFRKKKYATDVLSFPAPAPFLRGGFLGEIVICLPVMEAQAKECGHAVQTELNILLIHGVLHLLGMDHEEGPRHAARMARWESRLLQRLSRRSSSARRIGLIGRAESSN